MKKRLADYIAIFSTLLLILLLADWHHSYSQSEVILLYGPAGRPLILTAGRGVLFFAVSNVPIAHALPWSCDFQEASPTSPMDSFEGEVGDSNYHLGFRIIRPPPRTMAALSGMRTVEPDAYGFSVIAGKDIFNIPGTYYAMSSVPFWAMVPPLAWISFLWSKKKLQSRSRRRRGCCRQCGYDLRASPDRCPECGTAPLARGSAGAIPGKAAG